MKPPLILTFDLEFWHNSEFIKKYIRESDKAIDITIESTLPLLNFLKSKNIYATFFVLGQLAEKHPPIIKRISDDGHEIASHGYSHTPVSQLTPPQFEEELAKTEHILKKITGKKPCGFRAPDFSLTTRDLWAFKILKKRGYTYDSSIFPFRTGLYGESHYYAKPFKIAGITEIPLSIYNNIIKIPIAGGFYFRAIPLPIFIALLKSHARTTTPMIYLHPHELYPFIPSLPLPFWKKTLKYWNVKNGLKKLTQLIRQTNTINIQQYLTKN